MMGFKMTDDFDEFFSAREPVQPLLFKGLKQELTIEIPRLPPKEASPNYRPFSGNAVFVARRAITDFQRTVYLCAVDARNKWEKVNGPWKTLERATIKATFIVKDRRHIHDSDNSVILTKSAVDVLTEGGPKTSIRAGLIVDDTPEILDIEIPEYKIDKKRAPMTILVVRGS